jgi:hypothetical protein
MPHHGVIGQKNNSQDIADDADAFSVAEFCERHRISIQLFYKNREQMPRTFNVGARVLISKEAAAAWRREREQDAQPVHKRTPTPQYNSHKRNVSGGQLMPKSEIPRVRVTIAPGIYCPNCEPQRPIQSHDFELGSECEIRLVCGGCHSTLLAFLEVEQ